MPSLARLLLGALEGAAVLAHGTAFASATSLTFTDLTIAGATGVFPFDINDRGQVVGSFFTGAGIGSQGFLYDNGAVTPINVPGAIATAATGINSRGQIVGTYSVGSLAAPVTHGFLIQNGGFTPIDVPNTPGGSHPTGINDRGQIVGVVGRQGFLDTNGQFTVFDVPVALTSLGAINNAGQIVGEAGGHGVSGLIGAFTIVDAPDAEVTHMAGINNVGLVTGSVLNSTGGHQGFLYDGQRFTRFDVPGAELRTFGAGINERGDIVGWYTDDSSGAIRDIGFIATPVSEPPGIWLLVTAMLLLAAARLGGLAGRWLPRQRLGVVLQVSRHRPIACRDPGIVFDVGQINPEFCACLDQFDHHPGAFRFEGGGPQRRRGSPTSGSGLPIAL